MFGGKSEGICLGIFEFDCQCMEFTNNSQSIEIVNSQLPGTEGGKGVFPVNGNESSHWADGSVLELDCGDGCIPW